MAGFLRLGLRSLFTVTTDQCRFIRWVLVNGAEGQSAIAMKANDDALIAKVPSLSSGVHAGVSPLWPKLDTMHLPIKSPLAVLEAFD